QMVRYFQRVIGDEARKQILEKENRLPDHVVACVGGGSNAIGMFAAFLEDREVHLHGVEAAGKGLSTGKHAATLCKRRTGVLHGPSSYLRQYAHGPVLLAHSMSAGSDTRGVAPERAPLEGTRRARYAGVTDGEALEAVRVPCRTGGI